MGAVVSDRLLKNVAVGRWQPAFPTCLLYNFQERILKNVLLLQVIALLLRIRIRYINVNVLQYRKFIVIVYVHHIPLKVKKINYVSQSK